MDFQFSPKEREAIVNRGLVALVEVAEFFKASTELMKIATEFAKEAVAEAKKLKDRKSRTH